MIFSPRLFIAGLLLPIVAQIATTNGALHLYGKAEVKAGRKMGHINTVTGAAV